MSVRDVVLDLWQARLRHRATAVAVVVAAILGLGPFAPHVFAYTCSGNPWNGTVGGVGAHAISCLDFPSGIFQGWGSSTTDVGISSVGADNVGGQICDGVYYQSWDSGWIYNSPSNSNATATGNSGLLSCMSNHDYEVITQHSFVQGSDSQNPMTSVSSQ